MKTLGERVRERRKELGIGQKALGELAGGLSYQAIQQIEAGGGTTHVVPLAKALKVTPEWLQSGTGEKELTLSHSTQRSMENDASATHVARVDLHGAVQSEGANQPRLRVLGMAECGPNGWSLWNGDVIDTVPMPPYLRGVKNAYAVFVAGDSMSPRFEAGEVAHIHPWKPVTIGAYVLVQKKPESPGEPPLAVIKRLVKRSPTKVTLAQLNPARTFEVKVDEIVSMHRVVGSAEA